MLGEKCQKTLLNASDKIDLPLNSKSKEGNQEKHKAAVQELADAVISELRFIGKWTMECRAQFKSLLKDRDKIV